MTGQIPRTVQKWGSRIPDRFWAWHCPFGEYRSLSCSREVELPETDSLQRILSTSKVLKTSKPENFSARFNQGPYPRWPDDRRRWGPYRLCPDLCPPPNPMSCGEVRCERLNALREQ